MEVAQNVHVTPSLKKRITINHLFSNWVDRFGYGYWLVFVVGINILGVTTQQLGLQLLLLL